MKSSQDPSQFLVLKKLYHIICTSMFYMLPAGCRPYNTNGRPPPTNCNSTNMIVSSTSINTPAYWVTNTPVQARNSDIYETSLNGLVQQRRTASSGLLMNIGYLNNGHGPPNAMGPGTDSEIGDELSPLPRPASAGAAAVVSGSAGLHENSVLYDYPPSLAVHVNSSNRHRGTMQSLRKQHSVSCASHCCEVAAAASSANQPKVW